MICSLDSSKSVGPCSIPTKILKITRNIALLPLSQLMNISIFRGIFPDSCKLEQVIPIFKNDPRLLCNNYRPILLLSNISKIFEKVIHCRLNLFLEQNNCLYPFQFGFRPNYSTNNVNCRIHSKTTRCCKLHCWSICWLKKGFWHSGSQHSTKETWLLWY